MDWFFEIGLYDHPGEIVGVVAQVVAVPWLAWAAMPSAIMGDDTTAAQSGCTPQSRLSRPPSWESTVGGFLPPQPVTFAPPASQRPSR